MGRSHPPCWDSRDEIYLHICQEPSERRCEGYPVRGTCQNMAGTWWTKHWCPDCDVARQDAISKQFERFITPYRKEGR